MQFLGTGGDDFVLGLQVDTNTLACTYAALICFDDGLPMTAQNIAALVKVRRAERLSPETNLIIAQAAARCANR